MTKAYFENTRNFGLRQNAYGCILAGFSFLVLTLLTIKIFAPEINTSAASQTAEQTVGPYTMSMSNDSVASKDITPTDEQKVYDIENNLTVKNDCSAGATIKMTTTSSTSNSLVRTGSDSLNKEIKPTTTTSLDDYSWGYALNNSSNYYAVPKLGTTAATVYDETVARTSAYPVSVKFGVKVDNKMPSGAYTNDVIYTMTPKDGCLKYTIEWDMNGGTKKSGATYPTSLGWGEKIDLSTLTPTRDGYTFTGWSDGSSNYTGISDINVSNKKSVKLTAQWSLISYVKNFDYTGGEQTWSAPYTGYYKLEVWGAAGGGITNANCGGITYENGGYGGYSFGDIKLNSNNSVYVVVGGQGETYNSTCDTGIKAAGGYNGGGSGQGGGGGGGGATHIATKSGLLSTLSSSKDSVLIVAGAGGGASGGHLSPRYGSCDIHSGAGGGTRGGDGVNINTNPCISGGITIAGGTQLSGGINSGESRANGGFGYGGSTYNTTRNLDDAGGGSGWYGGAGGNDPYWSSGAGGSGYIGNAMLEGQKGMYMYNLGCTASSDANTKTTCTNNYSKTAISNFSKTGNGYARITWLGDTLG